MARIRANNASGGGGGEWFDKNHYFDMKDSGGLVNFTNGQSVPFSQNRPIIFNTKDYTTCLAGSAGFTAMGIGIASDLSCTEVSSQIINRTVNVTNYDYLMILRTLENTSQTITFS